MDPSQVIAVALASTGASAVLIGILQQSPRVCATLTDRPNSRSLHAQATPRIGGIGLMLAGLGAVLPVLLAQLANVWLAAAALMIVSAIDDARSLPISIRLFAHTAAAILALWSTFASAPLWQVALALVALLWMTNLFNFMDGADGLAGGMAWIGFASLAAGAFAAGHAVMGVAAISVSAAALGFLLFNFPPAKVFMGDAGSIPLGFMAGSLGYYGAINVVWPLWFPILVFSPFILDATLTLLRRAWRGEPVWKAHRQHLYQRLILAGCSHRKLAVWSYGIMGLVSACAYGALGQPAAIQAVTVLTTSVSLAALFLFLEYRLSRATGA